MKILQVSLGKQEDIRDALSTIGEVIYWDWSGYSRSFNNEIKKLFHIHKPDLIFLQIQTPGILDIQTATYLASKSIVVNWTGDVRQNIDWYIKIGKVIQLTLFTNMNDVDSLRRHGVKSDYLQIGFPTKIFNSEVAPKENVPEIVFMANKTSGFPLSKYREDVVKALYSRYGDRFAVYGNSWGKKEYIHDQNEEARHYKGCKIAINLSHFNYSRYSSDRIFRIMGAGAFCLSHNYIDIGKDFNIGEHLDVWDDVEGLFSKIDFYLNNHEKAKEIAKKGCDHVHNNHTWINRVNELKSMI